MRSSRAIAAAAIALSAITGLAACGSSGGGSSASGSNGKVTLTWWNNGNNQPLRGVYSAAIKTFEKSHSNITIQNVPIQNDTLQKTKIPLALQGSNPPNIYQQWGGGALAQQVTSGKVADITSDVSSWIGGISGTAGWQANGKQYGVPVVQHVVGFWYRKDIFQKAGITPPATLKDLEADDVKLAKAGYAPIAVGGKDGWPDAFWWESFALRDCPKATITSAIAGKNFSDACFAKASTDLAAFIKTNPFQKGYNGTFAQQGAGSSAGLVANGKAAMELQGDWDPSTMMGVSSNKNLPTELGWFPFPKTPGSAGSQTAVLAGGDGFSCTGSDAQVKACTEFLRFLDSPQEQDMLVGQGASGEPVLPSESKAINLSATKTAAAYLPTADYTQRYFDTALPTKPGQNLNTA
ncbi:MAG: extracellular solute-binding protein, partial [Nocardiopsaceae bacterium]|nr:extracellular solute-binding protein [Nocardiopsaceae bacterium]